LRYHNLSEKQIAAFKKTIDSVKQELEELKANPPF